MNRSHRIFGVCCLGWILLGWQSPAAQSGRILQVGPGKRFELPSQASAAARDGDIIEIDAGVYKGDVAVWTANSLVLRGVGGRASLQANGQSAQGKGIWVITGNAVTVENIEFSGARGPDQNGAGIRLEGSGLTVRTCYFHDNENGILTGNNSSGDILIEGSEFSNNGHGDGRSHNIYVGVVRSFTLRRSYVHHARVGHNVKSRAQANYILYNRIMDEMTGTASYAIDLPNGGRSFVIGNLIQKGINAENPDLIAYAAEGATNPWQELYIVNNTLVSERPGGSFVRIHRTLAGSLVANNIFAGSGQAVSGIAMVVNNLASGRPLFSDREKFDYRLVDGSPAINAGIDPGSAAGFDLSPRYQYVHPRAVEERNPIGRIDIGAYEFGIGERRE
jgi:hypothetical protein